LPEDSAEALKWYTRAAEQGLAEAQTKVGYAFYNGVGTSVNYTQAMLWFQRAAGQKFAEAEFNLGVMYQRGEGVERDFRKLLNIIASRGSTARFLPKTIWLPCMNAGPEYHRISNKQ